MKIKLYILLFLVFLSLVFRLGSWGVTETSEARYSEIGRAMFQSGDLLHPELLHVHHYHKPPFTYAISALSYQIFGVNSFGSRFFLLIALLVQIYCVFKLAKRLFPHQRNIGMLSALIYSTIPIVIISTRNLTTDAYLTTFVVSSILTWVSYQQDLKPRFLYFTSILMALGFLTKGPLILLFVGSFMVGYWLSLKTKTKWTWHYLFSVALFLILGFSWYIILVKENPEFLSYFLGTQTIDRVATNRFDRGEPIWYYLVFGTVTTLPWIPVLLFLWTKRKHNWKRKNNKIWLLAFSFLIPVLILSLVTSKLIFYIIPALGPFAIWVAKELIEASKKDRKVVQKIIVIYYSVIALALVVAPWVQIDEDLQIRPIFCLFGVISLSGLFLINYKTPLSLNNRITYSAVFSVLFLFFSSTYFFSANELSLNSLSPVANFIKSEQLDKNHIVVYNRILPSLAFDLDQDIYFINNHYDKLNRETQFETNQDWKNFYYIVGEDPVEKLDQLLTEGSVLVTRKHDDEFYNQMVSQFNHQKEFGKWVVYY